MPSKTIIRAPIAFTRTSSSASMPPMSKSPLLTVSKLGRASINVSFSEDRVSSFQLKLAASERTVAGSCSKATKMPGEFSTRAPFTSACNANTVFPDPGPPVIKDVRPAGRPPREISSNPRMPVSNFAM